jgi:uridine kinase
MEKASNKRAFNMTENCKLVLIGGGSGVGKSTVAIELRKTYAGHLALVHGDDYFHAREDAPVLPDGSHNWDDPASLRFDDLHRDLRTLMDGRPIIVDTESDYYHGSYCPVLHNRLPYEIEPCPVILVEGHWALWDPKIRELAACRIYLDMPIELSMLRRGTYKAGSPEAYLREILVPAHKADVAPTRAFADVVIEITDLDQDAVFERVCHELRLRSLIP